MTLVHDSRRQKIFSYVSRHIMTRGYAPTIREIMAEVGIASTSNVVFHLDALASNGLLTRNADTARGMALGDAAGMNTNLSLTCHAATRWASTEVSTHLHEMCPGHVFQAWDQREFDCECGCEHGG